MRYCRQNLLRIMDRRKQKMLSSAKVCIAGCGALGTRVGEMLARAGVKSFTLIDCDSVEVSNLHRQALFVEKDVGFSKSEKMAEHLMEIDSSISCKSVCAEIIVDNVYLAEADIIIECTDRQETKLLLNELAVRKKIPMVYGAVLQTRGYVFNVVPGKTACISCFLERPSEFIGGCREHGVLNTACSMIATIQADEAMKILTGQDFERKLVYADIWKNSIEKIAVKRKRKCRVCGEGQLFIS